MAGVWQRRVIDFHSQAVNGGKITEELNREGDLTVLVPDNEQHQSGPDGREREEEGWGERGEMKNGGDRKRQEKAEEIRAPAAAPGKSSLRQSLIHRTLDRAKEISQIHPEPRVLTTSSSAIRHGRNKSSEERALENIDQTSAGTKVKCS